MHEIGTYPTTYTMWFPHSFCDSSQFAVGDLAQQRDADAEVNWARSSKGGGAGSLQLLSIGWCDDDSWLNDHHNDGKWMQITLINS